jgi:hypothetical protein
MSTGSSYVPLETVIFDAASGELGDDDYRKGGGRPFYVAAAQRGVSKMFKDTMMDFRTWTTLIDNRPIIDMPEGLEEIDQIYVQTGEDCNTGASRKVYVKNNMHRLGGQGYSAGDQWYNGLDPLQFSHGWSSEPPPNVLFCGRWQGQIHLSDSCRSWAVLRIDYQGLGMEKLGDDFMIPYWMRDAITDYVIMRGAQKMRRLDKNYMTQLIRDKEYQMERGSWLTARGYASRMDRKTRADTVTYMETFGGRV